MYDDIIRLFACVSLVIGAVECFAGFKIMKTMMAIWGFFIGSVLGVVIGVVAESTVLGVTAVILLGMTLAFLSFKLYAAGVFLLTSFLTATAVYIVCENIYAALMIAVVVGVFSIYFIKPMVISTTAISGAGIILSSAYLIMDLGINPEPVITAVLWIPIAVGGVVVQYITTKKIKTEKLFTGYGAKSPNPSMTFSERRYPGMQRAYRNYCIKCGCDLLGTSGSCPRCGYRYDD